MISKGEVDHLCWKVLLEEGCDGVQDEELVMARLVPNIVGRQIPSHVHQVEL